MFKGLKDKLKKVLSGFTKKVKEEAKVEEEIIEKEIKKPVKKEKKVTKKPVKAEVKEVIEKKEEIKEDPIETKPEVIEETVEEEVKADVVEEPEETIEVKEEVKEPVIEIKEEAAKEIEVKEEPVEKKSFLKKIFGKKDKIEVKKEPKEDKPAEDIKAGFKEEPVEAKPEKVEEKKGFFTRVTERITKIELSEDKFEELFFPLEVVLLENNVAMEVVEKIKEDMKNELTGQRVAKKSLEDMITDSLKHSIESLFEVESVDIIKKIKEKKGPYVIAMIGVNGSGKTTTMAKIANMLIKNKLSVVFAAADTFRAASIEQLQEHADKLKVKMIKHDYESDPAAVAFDAIAHAKSKNIDVVLIDTAGRLHSNTNLMEELKKIIRVNNPDLKLFIGESTTGNDCVEQAREFDNAVGIDVIILTKADVDEKGGAAISISFVTGKPIIYLGTGQTYDDLKPFKKEIVLESLF